MRNRIAWAAAPVLAVLCLGCSDGEPAPTPSGRALARPEPPADRPGENRPPEVRSVRLNPDTPMPGVAVTAVVDAVDPDGDSVRLGYVWKRNGREIERGARPSVFLSDLAKGDTVAVEVVATDGQSDSRPRTASARVPNRAPIVDAVEVLPEGTPRAGDLLVAAPLARDPDDDALGYRFRWTVNGSERGHARELDTKGLRRGDEIQVEVVASDGEDASRPARSRVLTLANTPPRITRLPDLRTDDGSFSYRFEAKDPDGDRNLRFWLEQGPRGMAIDPIDGQLTWTPEASQAGTHAVEVGVRDGAGDGTTFLFEVTVTTQTVPANAAPE